MDKMSKEDRSIRLLKKKIRNNLQENEWYAASMSYKTLFSRLVGNKKYKDAIVIITSGIDKMFEVGEDGAAMDLISELIDICGKDPVGIRETEELDMDLLSRVFDNTPEHTSKKAIDFYMRLLKVFPGDTHPEYFVQNNLRLALAYERISNFMAAQDRYMYASDPKKFAKMLITWADHAFPHERDLILARAILKFLAIGGTCEDEVKKEDNDSIVDMCIVVLEEFVNHYGYIPVTSVDNVNESAVLMMTPLINFLNFFLTALSKHSAELFNVVRSQYKKSLERDKNFGDSLNEIGLRYFNIPKPESGGISQLFTDFLPTMMQMMGPMDGLDPSGNDGDQEEN